MWLETGCRSGCLQMETWKRVQETRERTEHLSRPRVLSCFLVFSFFFGLMSWPVSQFAKNAFPNGGIILKMNCLRTGLSHLQYMGWCFRFSSVHGTFSSMSLCRLRFSRRPVELESHRSWPVFLEMTQILSYDNRTVLSTLPWSPARLGS